MLYNVKKKWWFINVGVHVPVYIRYSNSTDMNKLKLPSASWFSRDLFLGAKIWLVGKEELKE
jgi:hypothetical protein